MHVFCDIDVAKGIKIMNFLLYQLRVKGSKTIIPLKTQSSEFNGSTNQSIFHKSQSITRLRNMIKNLTFLILWLILSNETLFYQHVTKIPL